MNPPTDPALENHFATVPPGNMDALLTACGVFIAAARRRLRPACALDVEMRWAKINLEASITLRSRFDVEHPETLAAKGVTLPGNFHGGRQLVDTVWRTQNEVLDLLADACSMQERYDQTVFVLNVRHQLANERAARTHPKLAGKPLPVLSMAALESALARAIERSEQLTDRDRALFDDTHHHDLWRETLDYIRSGGLPVLRPRTNIEPD